MSRNRRVVATLIIGMMIGVGVYLIRSLVGLDSPSNLRDSLHPRAQHADAKSSSSDSSLAVAESSAIAAIEGALEQLAGPNAASPPLLPTRVASGCSWPPDIRRNSSSIPARLLFGQLKLRHLARHELLNERDVVLCPEDLRELEALIDRHNEAIGPILSALFKLKSTEMVALIDSGAVSPWKRLHDLETQIAARATALMSERDMKESEARTEATKLLYSSLEAPPGNHIRHNGLIYLDSDFPPLPKTEALYENVKFLVGEYAAVLVAWFVQKGLCTDPSTPMRIAEGIAVSRAI